MPPPQPHYRLSLGEHNGQHSWMVQSRRSFGWYNLPPELEQLVQTLRSVDVVDFELGGQGRWYIKYLLGGRPKRKLSKGLWAELNQSHNHNLDRLHLGNTDCFWSVVKHNTTYQALTTWCNGGDDGFYDWFEEQVFHSSTGEYSNVESVAFGSSRSYCVKLAGKACLYSRGPGFGLLRTAINRYSTRISSIIMSPLDPDVFVLILHDGTFTKNLPSYMDNYISPYITPQYSFISPRAAVQTSPSFLRHLQPSTQQWKQIAKLFISGWLHPNKQDADIHQIYAIDPPASVDDAYRQYRARLERMGGRPRGNERHAFHGTPRRCKLGDSPSGITPCTDSTCNVCCIIRGSFSLKKAGTAPNRNFMRFGRGIYTTSVSSKADDYNGDENASGLKALLVARVALGIGYTLLQTTTHLTSPPAGFDSVLGEVGYSLNYDEQVVYCDAAIRPAYLIIYRP